MAKKNEKTFYQINYRDPRDGSAVSIKAKTIADSSLGLSFVSISDFIFETGGVLVNPEEEARKHQFENVKTLHLSIYSILSITEIGQHENSLSFENDRSNLLVLNNEPTRTPTN